MVIMHTVAVGRVGNVGPAQRAHLTTAHSCHEQPRAPRARRIDPLAFEGDLVGLAPAPRQQVAGGRWPARPRGSDSPNGRACPRPRSEAVRRYPASTSAKPRKEQTPGEPSGFLLVLLVTGEERAVAEPLETQEAVVENDVADLVGHVVSGINGLKTSRGHQGA